MQHVRRDLERSQAGIGERRLTRRQLDCRTVRLSYKMVLKAVRVEGSVSRPSAG